MDIRRRLEVLMAKAQSLGAANAFNADTREQESKLEASIDEFMEALGVETSVFIVTASGPRPEKAAGSQFFLTRPSARGEAERLTSLNAPARYAVHPMLMRADPAEERGLPIGEVRVQDIESEKIAAYARSRGVGILYELVKLKDFVAYWVGGELAFSSHGEDFIEAESNTFWSALQDLGLAADVAAAKTQLEEE